MQQNYKEYLQSAKWLIKKSELIAHFLKHHWKICCTFCGVENNLQVHHWRYDNVGSENIEDGDIDFACKDCHYKWHFDQQFKKEWLEVEA